MSDIRQNSMSKEDEKQEIESKSKVAARAMELFRKGYNCSQAVLCAFTEDLGLDIDTASRLASSFGGGMGRMREVCGAVSGMFMVAGLACGYSDPKAYEEKAQHYERIQMLANEFKKLNGSIICRVLLGLSASESGNPIPEKRTDEYYKKRPCEILVGQAAMLLDEYIMSKS